MGATSFCLNPRFLLSEGPELLPIGRLLEQHPVRVTQGPLPRERSRCGRCLGSPCGLNWFVTDLKV